MHTALSIAGTDPTGGAGIQADLKAMTMNGVFAMTAITAVVAQNTTGVKNIVEMSPDFLKQQIDVVFEDIYPDAVKIGMVASTALIEVIAERLRFYQARNIVVDPVMVATSGDRLIAEEALDALKKELLPLATVVTPNIPEAEILSGMTIDSTFSIEEAARAISSELGCAVLLKGGHNINDANDYLYADDQGTWFMGQRINNPNTHGTGCTLSSAIASNLAKGFDLDTSIQRAKDYLSGALNAMLDLGTGRGPMQHNFNLTGEFAQAYSKIQKD
ncbi:bifunctional hydroxymethylpyrimidine kinase/phosphomethylpyrimidine kinase [Alloscardovia criceti]|uniref:bifunctional hydroxymethylpyrimidine kinase/phosphomethylpyrimidine kinase n=1 Tax=Alloscardovia criceti TaxID=356828 RepID=UPI000373046E|nr:bifunctional hydroxymethylpyrimidine kinase/phosphomethylpyrimidine kinase [Alloscardovia criceti]